MTDDIGTLREQINQIDGQLLSLLNKRAEVAVAIGDIKAATGRPVYDPVREGVVFNDLESANSGPLSKGAVEEIYRTIITICREMQIRP